MPNHCQQIRTTNPWVGDLLFGSIDYAGLVGLVGGLQRKVGPRQLAVVRIIEGDPAVLWASFPKVSCKLPGAKVGQVADFRFTIGDGTGFHCQRFIADGVRIVAAHLDDHDGCTRGVEHAANATRAVEFGAIGAGLAALAALAFTRNPKIIAGIGAAGAGGGALLGAHTPTQARVFFDLADYVAGAYRWRAR